jgi:hypothetical protein
LKFKKDGKHLAFKAVVAEVMPAPTQQIDGRQGLEMH